MIDDRLLLIVLLGATGIVGQRFVQMLEHHPWFEVAWLAASDRSEGRPYAEASRWRLKTAIPDRVAKMTVSPAAPDGAPKLIFAALDASIAARNPGSECRAREADRIAGLAKEVWRIRGHQPQLFCDRPRSRACPARP